MKPVLALLSLAAAGAKAADTLPTPRFTDPARRARLEAALPEVEKVFERFRGAAGAPGLVFGLVIDGELAAVRASGVRDRAAGDPVTPDTVFRIASMTKSFTALAILKLRDEGKLSLDDPAAKWIPELARLRYPTRDTAPITVRQLLTHGAGFPEDNPWGDRQLSRSEETLTRWLEAGLPFSTPPATAYEYSNYGFALLGRIVARVSGLPYREYLARQILAPLGMKATTLEPSSVPAALRATGYRRSGEGHVEEPPLPDGAFGAMGGLLTSARDLGRYVAFHLSAWPPRDDGDAGPVRRSSVREMHHPWRPSSFGAARPAPQGALGAGAGAYGYGVSVRQDCRFNRMVSHGGGLPGFGSFMAWLPDYGVGIFAMTNLTYAGPGSAVDQALDVLRRTGSLKPRELAASPALLEARETVRRLWEKWDDEAAARAAADNLLLDQPAAERRAEIERLKGSLGDCRPTDEYPVENLLRGRFRMACERGRLDVALTLAPTMPPKIQFLRFLPAVDPSPQAKDAAGALASLIGSFREETLLKTAAPALDALELRAQLEALRRSYGGCRVGETISGDGRTNLRVRFACDRGPLDVTLRLQEDGKLSGASFSKPPDIPCVP